MVSSTDTTVSRYIIAVTLDPGGRDTLVVPSVIGKLGPPLLVRACLKDEGDGIACDSLTYSEL